MRQQNNTRRFPPIEFLRDAHEDRDARYQERFKRRLIPDPFLHSGEEDRFLHRDLESLTNDHIAAERLLLNYELARRIFFKERDEFLTSEISVGDWIQQRLDRLAAEQSKRRTNGRRVA